jgi:hypothetical protein
MALASCKVGKGVVPIRPVVESQVNPQHAKGLQQARQAQTARVEQGTFVTRKGGYNEIRGRGLVYFRKEIGHLAPICAIAPMSFATGPTSSW